MEGRTKMKSKEYTTKSGNTGYENTPENKDVFVCKFSQVKEAKFGKYTNYSLGVTKPNSEEILYIRITQGQKKILDKQDLKDKSIVFNNYDLDGKTHVGVKVL